MAKKEVHDWKATAKTAERMADRKVKAFKIGIADTVRDANKRARIAEEQSEDAKKQLEDAKRRTKEAEECTGILLASTEVNICTAKSNVMIKAREMVVEKGKRAVVVLEKAKDAARTARTKAVKQKRTDDSHLKQKNNTIRNLNTKLVMENRAAHKQLYKGKKAIQLERQGAAAKVATERKRRKESTQTDLEKLQEMRALIAVMKQETKEAKASAAQALASAAQAAEREEAITFERDTAMKHVSQLEIDFALKQSELDATLHQLSQPSFVFEKEMPNGNMVT